MRSRLIVGLMNIFMTISWPSRKTAHAVERIVVASVPGDTWDDPVYLLVNKVN